MWTLVRRRLFDAAIVVWLVGTIAFTLLHLAPGDPVAAALTDSRVSPTVRAHWRAVYALDRPLPEQYWRYVVALGRGDLGYSFSQVRPVTAVLRDTLPSTLLLASIALVASALLGLALGTIQAVRRGSRTDRVLAVVISGVSSVPEVWVALMLLAIFGAQLAWFPLNGRCAPVTCGALTGWRALADVLYHAALPSLTLTLLFTAPFARVQRVALGNVLDDEVMRTARAKGVPEWLMLLHHGVRRAARPLVTTIGMSLPVLVGGTVFVERVFGWPGMGAQMVNAIDVRDYPLVTAIAIVGSLLVLMGSLLSDLLSRWLDPQWSGGVA